MRETRPVYNLETSTGNYFARGILVHNCHYLKSPEAKRTQRVCRLLAQASKAIAISGTLIPNRPIELWPLLYALRIYRGSWNDFAFRYARAYEDERHRLVVTGASRLPELRELLRPHVIRFTKEQALPELPPKQWRVIALDLPLHRREKRLSLDDVEAMEESVAFEALSDVLRWHGLEKLPLAIEHVQSALESEPKVAVFCHHDEVMDGLAEALADYGVVEVRGGQSKRERQQAVDAFQEGSPRVLLGKLTAGGVGITLTAARRVVIVEGSWVPGDLQQVADRCHRIGQTGIVRVDVLTIHRSIDEHQLARAMAKVPVIRAALPTTRAARDWTGILA